MEIKDNLTEKIFVEIRKRNIGKNGIWKFQEYNAFRNDLNPIEKENFFSRMDELCDEGIFTKENNNERYRLTEKGEEEIYKEV